MHARVALSEICLCPGWLMGCEIKDVTAWREVTGENGVGRVQ